MMKIIVTTLPCVVEGVGFLEKAKMIHEDAQAPAQAAQHIIKAKLVAEDVDESLLENLIWYGCPLEHTCPHETVTVTYGGPEEDGLIAGAATETSSNQNGRGSANSTDGPEEFKQEESDGSANGGQHSGRSTNIASSKSKPLPSALEDDFKTAIGHGNVPRAKCVLVRMAWPSQEQTEELAKLQNFFGMYIDALRQYLENMRRSEQQILQELKKQGETNVFVKSPCADSDFGSVKATLERRLKHLDSLQDNLQEQYLLLQNTEKERE